MPPKTPLALHPYLKTKKFKCLVHYPDSNYKKDEILTTKDTHLMSELFFQQYPDVFQELPWYVGLTVGQLVDIKFIEVTEYVGYDHVGDQLPVTGYDVSDLSTANPNFLCFFASGRRYTVKQCRPATCAIKAENK